MIKKCLSYLLVALITLQSVGAMVGDEHQSHQDGIQHLEFDHGHDSKSLNKMPKIDEKSYSYTEIEFDCHHCCHCHGTCLSYLPTTSPNLLAPLNSLGLYGYNNNALDGSIFSLFRPPKV